MSGLNKPEAIHIPPTMSCLANGVQIDGRSPCTTQSNLYSQAADVTYSNPQHPRWWFHNDKAEDFLRSPNSTICIAEDERAATLSRKIARDSIRFLRDEINKVRSSSWKEVRDMRPVLYIASCPSNRWHRRRPSPSPPTSDEGREDRVVPLRRPPPPPKKPVLKYMINQLFHALRPLVPRTWQPWFPSFDELSIDDQLDVLESLPRPLPPMVSPVDQRLCIIVGLDDAYSQETHDLVERFLRIIEQLFITDRRGKILFMCLAPLDIKSMLKGESCVMNLKEKY
ncbi:hypothetical protein F5Y02DRAFT_290861 [Annulohypoxylon stygium]|nr:hypothetical protein F5Y02DRAFT_290861 [Annulohypoxylon stygium]